MRPRLRALLIVEVLLGVVPLSALYLYFFPVGVFWIRQVAGLAAAGTVNAFTVSIAVIFVAGGLGLVSLWLTMVRRLSGRGAPGRIARSGLLLGMAVAIAVLALASVPGGLWLDYYVYGAPLVVAAQQLFSKTASGPTRVRDAPPPGC